MKYQLSREQITTYQENGFLIIPDFLDSRVTLSPKLCQLQVEFSVKIAH